MMGEPSRMSPYSSRSVSIASTCCMRRCPLLVPGPRQSQSLIPGRQLNRPARLFRQGHPASRERCAEHCSLAATRSAPGVNLDAVAEPPHLGITHPISLAGELLPHIHKARILQHSSIKRIPALTKKRCVHDVAKASSSICPESRIASSTAIAVEGVGKLLHRCGTRFLQVVTADVGRVPRESG